MLGEYLDDAYNSWLADALSCCTPAFEPDAVDSERRGGLENHMTIRDDQPRPVLSPISDPPERPSKASSRELLERSRTYASQISKRGAFSARRRVNAYNGVRSRRPQIGRPMQISDPSDFKHVGRAIPRRTEGFRPLQLSIYMPDNQLSPLMPHFRELGADDSVVTCPPQAVMTHSRSGSAVSSSTIPRKPLKPSAILRLERRSARDSVDERESPLSTTSEWVALQPLKPPPRIPESASTQELMQALEAQLPRPPPAVRLRSTFESPHLVRAAEQYGRVKSALIERQVLYEQLKKLDTILEQRRSLYIGKSSRVTSVYNQPQERNNILPSGARPQTEPRKAEVRIARRATSLDASAAFNSHPPTHQVSHDQLQTSPQPLSTHHHQNPSQASTTPTSPPPPPPLPLTLSSPNAPTQSHPHPLRKSISTSRSRVSNWLFAATTTTTSTNAPKPEIHKRNLFNESITNTPKPVKIREGFYQCIDYNKPGSGGSLGSMISRDDDDDDEIFILSGENGNEKNNGRTTSSPPTTTPGSSPGHRTMTTPTTISDTTTMDTNTDVRRSQMATIIMRQEMDLGLRFRHHLKVSNIISSSIIHDDDDDEMLPIRVGRDELGIGGSLCWYGDGRYDAGDVTRSERRTSVGIAF